MNPCEYIPRQMGLELDIVGECVRIVCLYVFTWPFTCVDVFFAYSVCGDGV